MKKIAPLALGVLLASGVAHADPTIYGRVYAIGTMDNLKTTTTDTVTGETTTTKTDRPKLGSASTRIGFKGSSAISDNTDAIYGLEYGARVDSESGLTARNAYVGLKNKQYGQVRAGRLYTIDDDINYADLSYIWADNGGTAQSYYGQRANNVIEYRSPKIANSVTVMAQYALDEGDGGGATVTTFKDGKPTSVQRDLGIIGAYSEVSGKYFAGATYTKAGDDFAALRAEGTYDLTKQLKGGAMVQIVDYKSGNKETDLLVSAKYQINEPLHGYAQVAYADNYKGFKDAEKKTVAVGGVYFLTKKIRSFGSVGYGETTEYSYNAAGNLQKSEKKSTSLDIGIRYDY